ncbi:latent-transforming growth factor beta-binding protein 2 [Folsomia candida]|uniref:Teneurin-4 n=1 Tax=Folsomia candida TaxID=158441 RepID=A0A226DP71_FOLCA|nr:latent-transforming growth factor beta-binding protein 2 [Folsomia candida]OXA46634.1 Teneurin-4 [Folsomia candida]
MSTKLFAIAVLTIALATYAICAPQYGETCSSINQCTAYSNNSEQSIICMFRPNATNPVGLCYTTAVAAGKCACARNCGAFSDHHENGEYSPEEGHCVAFVGRRCYKGWPGNDCGENAYCPTTSSYCVCKLGFETGPDGRHCVTAKK